jgi:Tol biopolymer transport system component
MAPEWTIGGSGPIALGTQIGSYRIESPLGEGGTGTVYRAVDTKLNRPVAVKFLSSDLADAAARRRFQQEAQLASSLNHPHILTVYDAGEWEGRQCLVTEFVDGGTLRDWIGGRSRDWREVLELLTGVADGLAAAHEAGILHRDIKPANILVARNGYAKLADFGLAKLSESGTAHVTHTLHTRPGVVVGTIPYMSPEQAAGRPLDARSDIFSFGVVLHEALDGKRPFGGASDLQVLENIMHGEAAPIEKELPVALRMAVSKALARDPAQRYQSSRELIVDLKRALHQATGAGPSVREQSPRAWNLKPWLWAAGAAALLFAGAAGYWRLEQSEYFWTNPLEGARVEKLTDFPGSEIDAAISPDGTMAAFMSDRDGRFDVWMTRIGTGKFTNVTNGQIQIGFGPTPRTGFSSDNAQVWVSAGVSPDNQATYLAPAAGGPLRQFFKAVNPAWSPDGRLLLYHPIQTGDPTILADANAANQRQIAVADPRLHRHYLLWSRDARHIYFVQGVPTTEEMDIWRVPVSIPDGDPQRATTGPAERITSHNGFVTHPSWLDDQTLVYSAPAEDGSGQSLYATDVERRIPHRIRSGIGQQYTSVSVSRSTPRRLVASLSTPTYSLWSAEIAARPQTAQDIRRLEIQNARALAPRFGPGGYLLFLSSLSGRDGLWKLENGEARELWTNRDGGMVSPPAVSRDGSLISFSYRAGGREGLYVMNSDGTGVRPLAQSLDVRGAASWSQDGKWIVVAANGGDGTRLYKIPLDGGPPLRLLDVPAYNPVWSPDGSMIVYSEQVGGGVMPVKAVSPDGTPVPLPKIEVSLVASAPYRFVPGRRELIHLAMNAQRRQNFFWIDLSTGDQRQLTDLGGVQVRNFDVSPDGRQIVFTRVEDQSDIVVMDLAR